MSRKHRKQLKNFLSTNGFSENCSTNGAKRSAPRKPVPHVNEEPAFHLILSAYFSYAVLIVFGYLRDFLRNLGFEKNKTTIEVNREGYVRLYQSFESFFNRNLYRRARIIFNMPITGNPSPVTTLIDRETDDYNWTFTYPGTVTEAINMGSYDYLGFAYNSGPISDKVEQTIRQYGVGLCTTSHELGTTDAIIKLEEQTARYLGLESCALFGNGFGTTSTIIRGLVSKGCLILSDQLNHSSIALGCRLSGATIHVFRHNDMEHLEQKIRDLIVSGQPKTHRPWRKVLICCEGIYSMEGTILNLPEVIRIKKKYKCYLYIDEAHSVGAIGPKSRGVSDYYGCDSNDIDILMGTFSKGFGAAGGYIAGKKHIIDYIRQRSGGAAYANSMSPAIAGHVSGVLTTVMAEDGTNTGQKHIKQLAGNAKYFRKRLKQMGFIIYGNEDSPVVPLLVYFPSNLIAVVRLAYEKGVALVGVAFPATPLIKGRIRICLSAAHTKQMLDKCLAVLDEIGDKLKIKYSVRTQN